MIEPQRPKEEIFDQFYDLNSVASTTELTGMVAALPQSNEEVESYANIQGIPRQGSKESSQFHS